MTSIVSICNLALSHVGKENISALSEASTGARACNQFYDHVRGMMLQSYPWRFAGMTRSLAEVANDKPGQWSYAYSLPTDYLKVRWVRPKYSEEDVGRMTRQQEISVPYDIEGGKLYTDLSPTFLRFTGDITDPTKFPPLFVEALSWSLAVRLAMPLTRDPKIRADAFQVATAMSSEAMLADANEVRETSDHESELVEGRS